MKKQVNTMSTSFLDLLSGALGAVILAFSPGCFAGSPPAGTGDYRSLVSLTQDFFAWKSAGSDPLALDMSAGGGSERLSNDQINATLQRQSRKLGGCLSRGGGYAKIQFIVDGPTGKVSWVKVNGQQSGAMYSCINRALRALSFPTVDGPRTRAEFDMEL